MTVHENMGSTVAMIIVTVSIYIIIYCTIHFYVQYVLCSWDFEACHTCPYFKNNAFCSSFLLTHLPCLLILIFSIILHFIFLFILLLYFLCDPKPVMLLSGQWLLDIYGFYAWSWMLNISRAVWKFGMLWRPVMAISQPGDRGSCFMQHSFTLLRPVLHKINPSHLY